MVGSRDLPASTAGFGKVFYQNQFREKPQWPATGTTLADKTAIITGGNTGLGYEVARQLLNLNLSHLIIAVRSIQKGDEAAVKLRLVNKKANIEVWQLDMNSYDSIQAFARKVNDTLPRVDYVLLNAGIMSMTYRKSPETGHEEIFQVNYLSTVLLMLLLLPILKNKHATTKSSTSEPPHISIVSAALTLIAKMPNRDADPLFPSFDGPKNFNAQEHYNSSKLMAQMFLWKLVDYVNANDVIVNLADPAWVRGTNLTRDTKGIAKVAMRAFEMTGRTPEVGASCLVDGLVTKGVESHGCFLMSWKIHP
jgi:NAD(P)-dependent dehydrogenase (short-subunit alcohol dehydrogenase family)